MKVISYIVLDRLHKKGGGVCAYIRKDIKSLVLKDLSYISETNFHQLWIKSQYKKSKSLLVCVSYRPPDSPLDCFGKYFKPSYVQALTMGKLIIFLGDLNCDMLKPTPGSAALTNTITELNLIQLIKSPTRITESSQTLVDVIFISSPKLVVDCGVIGPGQTSLFSCAEPNTIRFDARSAMERRRVKRRT